MANLDGLMIFAKIVEAHSFSEAARRLKMPISTVSRRIAGLEDQLGVRLLERSTRRLRLTDIGSEVLEHAQRSVELSEVVDNIVSNELAKVSGLLRLSAPPSISDTLLAPLIGAFQASYPDVRVQVLVTDRLVDHIGDGVDLVFRLGALRDSSLVARRILTYRHQLVASTSRSRCFPTAASATFRRWYNPSCCGTGCLSRSCRSGAFAPLICRSSMSATATSRGRSAYSRNSRRGWRRHYSQRFRPEPELTVAGTR